MIISDQDIEYYLQVAKLTALRSRAKRLKVGAVLVNSDRVMAVGYNGTPAGWDNECELHTPTGLITKPEVIHGELNALFKFVNNGISTTGTTMFLTHSPCIDCARALYLAKLHAIYYLVDYRSGDGVEFLRKAGISVEQLNNHSRGGMNDYDTQAPHCSTPHGRNG